jgi:hypothetical protein
MELTNLVSNKSYSEKLLVLTRIRVITGLNLSLYNSLKTAHQLTASQPHQQIYNFNIVLPVNTVYSLRVSFPISLSLHLISLILIYPRKNVNANICNSRPHLLLSVEDLYTKLAPNSILPSTTVPHATIAVHPLEGLLKDVAAPGVDDGVGVPPFAPFPFPPFDVAGFDGVGLPSPCPFCSSFVATDPDTQASSSRPPSLPKATCATFDHVSVTLKYIGGSYQILQLAESFKNCVGIPSDSSPFRILSWKFTEAELALMLNWVGSKAAHSRISELLVANVWTTYDATD